MDHVGGKGGVGTLVALGAHVSVAPDGVQRGVVMGDGGNGLTAVALAAGNVAPGSVDVLCLLRVAGHTGLHIVKLDGPMGIGQVNVGDFWDLRAISEGGPHHPGDAQKRARRIGLDFGVFVVPGRSLPVFVSPYRSGHFLLGRGYRG
jgi:hypothetical protein